MSDSNLELSPSVKNLIDKYHRIIRKDKLWYSFILHHKNFLTCRVLANMMTKISWGWCCWWGWRGAWLHILCLPWWQSQLRRKWQFSWTRLHQVFHRLEGNAGYPPQTFSGHRLHPRSICSLAIRFVYKICNTWYINLLSLSEMLFIKIIIVKTVLPIWLSTRCKGITTPMINLFTYHGNTNYICGLVWSFFSKLIDRDENFISFICVERVKYLSTWAKRRTLQIKGEGEVPVCGWTSFC